MNQGKTRDIRGLRTWGVLLLAYLAVASCATQGPGNVERHRWWVGLGPVLPHDSFPTDCKLCHLGQGWHELADDFSFDHQQLTGLALGGAHVHARCLRCHNDRGPVHEFAAKGCIGCHQDVHEGHLGVQCESCHSEHNWRAVGQIERHNRSRFPLVGAHTQTACHRCHPGAFNGRFAPVDSACVTCHRDDRDQSQNPPHLGLGWTDRCERCHIATRWTDANN